MPVQLRTIGLGLSPPPTNCTGLSPLHPSGPHQPRPMPRVAKHLAVLVLAVTMLVFASLNLFSSSNRAWSERVHGGATGTQAVQQVYMGSGTASRAGDRLIAEEQQQPVNNHDGERALSFQVCGSYAEQRLSILYGILLAIKTKRIFVLPKIKPAGLSEIPRSFSSAPATDESTQGTDETTPSTDESNPASDESTLGSEERSDASGNYDASGSSGRLLESLADDGGVGGHLNTAGGHSNIGGKERDGPQDFGSFYDEDLFVKEMSKLGVQVLRERDVGHLATSTDVDLDSLGPAVLDSLKAVHGEAPHLSVTCPLYKLPRSSVGVGDTCIMWAVLNALQPAKSIGDTIRELQQRIGAVHPEGYYNMLHLHMEREWLGKCLHLERLANGEIHNNCANNTDDVDVYLRLMGFSPNIPLYIASHWPDVDPQLNASIMTRLIAANYTVITFPSLLSALPDLQHSQHVALIEYSLALESHKFIGNSVSSFSALAMLQRRQLGKWAAYYNSGNVPLATMLPPLHRMPWVFTYNSWSPNYDYMLKTAVRSAAGHGTLKPYCLFSGDTSSEIYQWLLQHNVTLVNHKPAWRELLIEKATSNMEKNVQWSPLYKSTDMLISTFQRIDLSVVPLLNQYTYVLYTDADVVFSAPVTLEDFGLPLPGVLSMAYEFGNTFPYNAGIMLMNLPKLRTSYDAFVSFTFANNNGLHFGKYGPADQGALNQFYETDLKSQLLDQRFNSKPYNEVTGRTAVVHFHGPKPHDYVSYIQSGKCNFYWLCESAFLKSLCIYNDELQRFMHENEFVKDQLQFACDWLSKPQPQPTWGNAGEYPTATMLQLHTKIHSTKTSSAKLQGGATASG